MRQFTMQFPIVIYPSEDDNIGRYTAHCLNMDLLADDETIEGAVSKLLETIEVQLDAAEQFNSDPFNKAPVEYWHRLGQGRELASELTDRIIANANKRHGNGTIDVRRQCELRQQLEFA